MCGLLLCSRASLSWTHWATVAGGSNPLAWLGSPNPTHQASTYVGRVPFLKYIYVLLLFLIKQSKTKQ